MFTPRKPARNASSMASESYAWQEYGRLLDAARDHQNRADDLRARAAKLAEIWKWPDA